MCAGKILSALTCRPIHFCPTVPYDKCSISCSVPYWIIASHTVVNKWLQNRTALWTEIPDLIWNLVQTSTFKFTTSLKQPMCVGGLYRGFIKTMKLSVYYDRIFTALRMILSTRHVSPSAPYAWQGFSRGYWLGYIAAEREDRGG